MRMLFLVFVLAGAEPPTAWSSDPPAAKRSPLDDAGFYVARVADKTKWNFASDFDSLPKVAFKHDLVVLGPKNGKWSVVYATLQNPTGEQVKAALEKAYKAWEAEGKVSSTATPFPTVRPDRHPELPVGSVDALDELNAKRSREGLKPFVYDEGLTIAAARAAKARAERLLFGHLDGQIGDFACLPSGVNADAAGCAAYPESYGWMSCCMNPRTGDDGYKYAGAAYVIGSDGKRYMHLFVRY